MLHKYIRAIGFSAYKTKKEEAALIQYVIEHGERQENLFPKGQADGVFIEKTFGENFGIRVYCEKNAKDESEWDYYFPYLNSNVISSQALCSMQKANDQYSFSGLCEDPDLAVSLIYYLNNGLDIEKERENRGEYCRMEGVSLTALALKGKVLLPTYKTVRQKQALQLMKKEKGNLIDAARDGDTNAIEHLALGEMDTMRKISERIEKEDIYTIIDTCFMPSGLECDQYMVIGEIMAVKEVVNCFTEEKLWNMDLECNGVKLTLMVNQKDLLGVPEKGRRFKGDIWLQGRAFCR